MCDVCIAGVLEEAVSVIAWPTWVWNGMEQGTEGPGTSKDEELMCASDDVDAAPDTEMNGDQEERADMVVVGKACWT